MTNNKKTKKKKVKKEIVYRTKEERKEEVKNILKQLSDFDLNIKYEPIKKLYQHQAHWFLCVSFAPVVEGGKPSQHLINQNTRRPPVHRFSVSLV